MSEEEDTRPHRPQGGPAVILQPSHEERTRYCHQWASHDLCVTGATNNKESSQRNDESVGEGTLCCGLSLWPQGALVADSLSAYDTSVCWRATVDHEGRAAAPSTANHPTRPPPYPITHPHTQCC